MGHIEKYLSKQQVILTILCEAQLSFPLVYLKKVKLRQRTKLPLLTYSTVTVPGVNPKLTNIELMITFSDPTMTYNDLQ